MWPLAVIKGGRINRVFLLDFAWPYFQAKQVWPYKGNGTKVGFQCIFFYLASKLKFLDTEKLCS